MIKKGSMFLIFFLGLFYGSQALAWNACIFTTKMVPIFGLSVRGRNVA